MNESSDETDEPEEHPGGCGSASMCCIMLLSTMSVSTEAPGMSSEEMMELSSSSSLDMTERWHNDGRDMMETSSPVSSYEMKLEPSDANDAQLMDESDPAVRRVGISA